MTQIKICGLTTPEAVQQAANLEVNYIGFVLAPSKRQVSPDEVTMLCKGIKTPTKIGVFVNSALDELLRAGEFADLDGYQLHGFESPKDCEVLKKETGKQVWKAWQIRNSHEDLRVLEYADLVDALLLDAYHPEAAGGTGQKFSWEVISQLREHLPNVPLIIAGGLDADTVEGLIRGYRPYGVDVSSGVETDGIKDLKKMKQFVDKVRESQ